MITILQHGENEPAGTITEYLNAHNESFRILRLYEQDKLPDNPPEKLIILGGQMSVNDENLYPFLSAEKKLVIIPGATHLFEEPGKIEEVAKLSADWFLRYLK